MCACMHSFRNVCFHMHTCTNSFHMVCVFTCVHALIPFILCVRTCTPFIVCVCVCTCALLSYCVYVCVLACTCICSVVSWLFVTPWIHECYLMNECSAFLLKLSLAFLDCFSCVFLSHCNRETCFNCSASSSTLLGSSWSSILRILRLHPCSARKSATIS